MESLSRRALLRTSVAAVAGVSAAFASDLQVADASQWSIEDVYRILNDSPWAKPVRVVGMRTARPSEASQGSGDGTWGEGVPGGTGTGRGGWIVPGAAAGRRGFPRPDDGPTVTVRWASALPVRLAEAKSSGSSADAAALTPMDRYVIAVVGMPKSGFAPRGSGRDSDADLDDKEFANHLKTITTLSFGRQRIGPDKVELNQGRDDRTVFYFDKTEPITLKDKDVEFRVNSGRMEIRKKFPLKEMQYKGKLDL